MQEYLRRITLLIAVTVVMTNTIVTVTNATISIDARGFVSNVISSDELEITLISVFNNQDLGGVAGKIIVRLADIRVPPTNTTLGKQAKSALESMALFSPVIIDVDGSVKYDDGSVPGIVYLPLNETHVINLNAWLVSKGYAVLHDDPNQFSPSNWRLVEPLAAPPTPSGNQASVGGAEREHMFISTLLKLLVFFIVVLAAVIIAMSL